MFHDFIVYDVRFVNSIACSFILHGIDETKLLYILSDGLSEKELDLFEMEYFQVMNSYNKRRWRILRYYMIGWTVSFIFLSIVRGVGTEELGELQFDFQSSLLIAFTMGPIIGLISGTVQILIEERIYKRISIRKLLILRFFYAVLFILVMIVIAYGVYQLYFGTDISIIHFAFDTGSGAIYFYVLLVDLILNVLRQVNMMLGNGNLSKFIRGEFYTPREEERIFMFLDLQASTQLAEQLGHVKYSLLLQDCFNDLGAVAEYAADIYQYVGDEAVLTWDFSEGLKNQNCLKAFFRFKEQLKRREDHYQKRYGILPFFKAGVHAGKVMVTEIGKFKREIAYHGDPVNTAARIQSQCNQYGEELLLSETLKDSLDTEGFYFKKVGDILLRGKQEEMALYSVKS